MQQCIQDGGWIHLFAVFWLKAAERKRNADRQRQEKGEMVQEDAIMN